MSKISIETNKPIAYDSPDHIEPYGTARDNTTNLRFNQKLFDYIPAEKVRLMDIGCSGGGLVKSILDSGGFGVGIEGSDYSKRNNRAEWATIPGHLFTADATERFQFAEDQGDGRKEPILFNVITAWEFFEHIAEGQLPGVIENIKRNLAPQGIVLASIAIYPDVVNGVQLHQTINRKAWWTKFFAEHGLERRKDVEHYFNLDMVRGTPIGLSFTIALTRQGETPLEPEKLRSLTAKNRPREIQRSLAWLAHKKTWWELSCYAFPPLMVLRQE
jgi:2-polyprenyl-3-methyl-5-hydroxy-6-metoxy-1,4-benzoquinol methylase